MSIFQSISVLNGLSKRIALVLKWKYETFQNFLVICKWNTQKEQTEIFDLLIINSFSLMSR